MSFLNPSLFLLSVWFFFYCTHWLLGEGMFISFESLMVVVWFLISFNIGELCYLFFSKSKLQYIWLIKDDICTLRKLKKFILYFSLVSLLFSLLYARIFIQYFGGITSYLLADVRSAVVDIPIPIWIRIPLLFSYTLLLISAVYYYKCDDIKYMLISSIPILIMSVAQSGRAGLLMVVVILFMAVIVREIINERKNEKKTFVKYGIYICLVGFIIFIGGAILRFRNMEIDSNSFFINSFKSYLLGSLSAFDVYIHNPDTPDIGYGRYSFSSLYGLLGIAQNEYGVYTNYLVYDIYGSTTNIFTAFRQMIDDFGILGAAIYMFVLGFLGGREFLRTKHGDHIAISFMLLFYMYLFHTPLLGVTVHNSILFSFFIPSLLLVPFCKKRFLWKR